MALRSLFFVFFFFNDTATTEIYTLSLHDALPILEGGPVGGAAPARRRLGARRRGPIVGGAVVLAVARADRPRPGNAARQRIEGVARLRETEARRGGDARAGPAGRAGQRDGAARCQHARARGKTHFAAHSQSRGEAARPGCHRARHAPHVATRRAAEEAAAAAAVPGDHDRLVPADGRGA